MSRKPVDPRFERIESLLRDALMEQVARNGFDAVRIETLCKAAGVNRTTFYLHHKDKYELLEVCLLGFFDEVESSAAKVVGADVEAIIPGLIRSAAENCRQRREFILRILEGGRFPAFQALFTQRMSVDVGLLIEQLDREGRWMSSSSKEHQVMFLSAAFFGSILHWIKSGAEEELDVFCRDLTSYAMSILAGKGRS